MTAAEQTILNAVGEAAASGAFEHSYQSDELRRAAGLRRSDLGMRRPFVFGGGAVVDSRRRYRDRIGDPTSVGQ
ncbi:MAG: hypothetical protein M3Z04_05760 [Chloroflexota bacterium]|nr:hypothetical protein [Chloroflexota bacterium]